MHAWVEHTGDACPVPAGAFVVVDLGDGVPVAGQAEDFAWGPGEGPDGDGRIRRYFEVLL